MNLAEPTDPASMPANRAYNIFLFTYSDFQFIIARSSAERRIRLKQNKPQRRSSAVNDLPGPIERG